MSFRQSIVDAIATRFGLIHAGHVFSLNDGDYTCASTPLSVTPWRRVPYSTAQVPAIAFWDTTQSPGPEAPIGMTEHRLEIPVVGWVAGSSAETTARSMLSDIYAAVGSDPRWGGLAKWTEVQDQTINVDQEGDVVAGCELKLIVVYETTLWRM